MTAGFEIFLDRGRLIHNILHCTVLVMLKMSFCQSRGFQILFWEVKTCSEETY